MKIKSLYIEKYKNLTPLTIDFEAGNGLTILVGNNGSGSGNFILPELASYIFFYAFFNLRNLLYIIQFSGT